MKGRSIRAVEQLSTGVSRAMLRQSPFLWLARSILASHLDQLLLDFSVLQTILVLETLEGMQSLRFGIDVGLCIREDQPVTVSSSVLARQLGLLWLTCDLWFTLCVVLDVTTPVCIVCLSVLHELLENSVLALDMLVARVLLNYSISFYLVFAALKIVPLVPILPGGSSRSLIENCDFVDCFFRRVGLQNVEAIGHLAMLER